MTSTTIVETILVVEDTASELELISHYLQTGGYPVISAITAQEAFVKAVELRPDIIITDVVMPGMSGFELCRKLKQHPATQQIPIVFCTSKDQEIDRLWGMKQGADAYLTKPFSCKQLIQVVRSVLS